jgi:aminopeptidase N
MELDNTILKVFLAKPLYSGSSVTLDIHFKTYYGNGDVRRRMKMFDAFGYKQYDGVQWFPKISVYDRKFGWTADQHFNREFYGDFGTYDVELTFPNIYIVEATGVLQNRDEVLPDSLRKKLDIKNFKDKKWNSPPSVIIQRSDKRKPGNIMLTMSMTLPGLPIQLIE